MGIDQPALRSSGTRRERLLLSVRSSRVLLAGLGVVALWASAFPAIRVASPELGAVGLSVARAGIGAVVLLALAPLLRVRVPARGDLPLIAACGVLLGAYQLLLNLGELSVPAGTSSVIVAAAPLVSVTIATARFGERLTPLKVIGSAIALGGVAIVCLTRSGMTLSGAVLIVVAATVVQGVYHPLSKPVLQRYSGLELATYALVIATIVSAPLLPLGWGAVTSAHLGGWIAAAYLGVFPSAVGFVLWGYAVAKLPVATSTSLLYLVPAVAILIAFLWLGEVPLLPELLGGVIVVAGVVAVSQGDRIRQRLHHRTLATEGQ